MLMRVPMMTFLEQDHEIYEDVYNAAYNGNDGKD